jgi:hypothetical protein
VYDGTEASGPLATIISQELDATSEVSLLQSHYRKLKVMWVGKTVNFDTDDRGWDSESLTTRLLGHVNEKYT